LPHSSHPPTHPSFPTRRSSDLSARLQPPADRRSAPARSCSTWRRCASTVNQLTPRQGSVLALNPFTGSLGTGEVVTFTNGASLVDRKSTRLNSSHDQISYAVFC